MKPVEDDVLRKVRAVHEAYARLHHFDVRAMVADLQARNLADDWPVVRRSPRHCRIAAPAVAPDNALQQAGRAIQG
ncbi:MAG TPA: hypothetical protein VMF69_03785 [Gemmataceae bacterium]|nr:hypothetical protein [Gemmataceae bacterium]